MMNLIKRKRIKERKTLTLKGRKENRKERRGIFPFLGI
jgi:hypothetical protein